MKKKSGSLEKWRDANAYARELATKPVHAAS